MVDDTVERETPPAGPAARAGRWNSRTVLTLGVVAAVVLGGVALGEALSRSSSAAGPVPVTCASTTPKLTVQGTGQASATPDVLTLVLQVNGSGPTANVALASDNLKVSGAVAALKGGGVAAKDIQTSGLSLQPQYAYPKGVPTVTGYQVTNSITATLRQVAKSGTVIDAVVGAAGNAVQIQSLTFSVAHPGQVEDLARARAVTQAVTHAKAMAAAAGRALGPVCTLRDQTQIQAPEPFPGNSILGSATAASGAVPVPIEAGSQSESDQITLVYALVARPAPGGGRR